MGGVVLAHADELGGQHGREQVDVLQRQLLAGGQRVLEERALQHADDVLARFGDTGRDAFAVTEPEQSHVAPEASSMPIEDYPTVDPPAKVAPT